MDTMPQNTPRKYNYFIPLIVVFILIVICGIIYGFYLLKYSAPKTSEGAFFDSELAMVSGKVTQIKDNMITVENKKGVKRSFPLSPAYTVMTTTEQGVITSSADLTKVEVGKQFSINLSLGTQGNLEITTIMPAIDTNMPPIAPAEITPPVTNMPSPATASRSAAPTPQAQKDSENSEE